VDRPPADELQVLNAKNDAYLADVVDTGIGKNVGNKDLIP
jgi:hypothetical protein